MSNQLYRYQDKLVKKSARGDKRNFLEQKAAMAEEAAKRGDSRAVYKITNEIIGKRHNLNGPVKDGNGKTVTAPDEISEVWPNTSRKFSTDLVLRTQQISPTLPFLELQINTEEPSTEELVQAARKLKNGRAPGSDRISAEMIKASLGACITVWITFFACIWKIRESPRRMEKKHTHQAF